MAEARVEKALITGASSGIGLATVLYMAERGYFVIGTGRSVDRLAGLRDEAARRNLRVAALELDINSDEAVNDVLPGLVARHGAIDVLVNNAGYGLWGPVESLSMEELKAQLETNFFAATRLIQAVLPGMLRRRKGTIVNVSSISGRIGAPFNGGYAASKFALEGLSESLREEVWPFGVRVALVEPGFFRTNFQQNQVIAGRSGSKDLHYNEYVRRYRSRHRLVERLSGDPVKVARVIHKIARSRRPRLRYTVGPEAWLGSMAVRLLPEVIFRALMGRAIR